MINMIKRGFAVLAMLVVLGLTACKKDSPENQDEVVDSIDLYELLKNNDLAAVIDWTYSKDADIDHALLVSKTSAEYSRDDLSLSINENSKKKIDELKAAASFTVDVTSAYNRISKSKESTAGVTVGISTSTDNKVIALFSGFKWGVNYTISIKFGSKSVKGIIATVDRNRDEIEIELPEYVVKLNGPGYNKSTDTYTGAKQDFSEAVFKAFEAGKIINADPAKPDFANADAFFAKEGKISVDRDAKPFSFDNKYVTTTFSPSSKLKAALESGGSIICRATTYCGQAVKFTQTLSVEGPGYDFMHLRYYTFNTKTEHSNLITKLRFEANDGSVEWWSQVYPSYYITKGDDISRISNRYALADYGVSYLNLTELAFNVVDGEDNIMEDAAISKANLTVKFVYADKEQGGKALPAADVTTKYKTYDDLWINNTTFYYWTNSKDFIPVKGIVSIKSGDAEFEIPTRFDRPKASVKYPDVELYYADFAIVRWTPFKAMENADIEMSLAKGKENNMPLIKELKDNRPNGVSFYVIKNGKWEVGNASGSESSSTPGSGNGYIKGISAYEAYRIDPKTAFTVDLTVPDALKEKTSVKMVDSIPNISIDNTGSGFSGTAKIGVKLKMNCPWDELSSSFEITVKG